MKIAIVTGASSGMGREAVFQIGDRFPGIDEVWVAARREERLRDLAGKTMTEDGGGQRRPAAGIPARVRCFAVDLTDPAGREKLSAALREEKPNVKILVNAAGFGVTGRIGSQPEETECGMVRLNCEALCAVTGMVLPYMGRNSRILQFSSAAAFLPQPGFAIYAASKAFVLSYSRALGAELKERDICVTAVCPGPVKTEFLDIAVKDGELPFYKKFVMADPKKVVKKAIRDSMAGRPVSVYGIPMKLFMAAAGILPHGLILKMMGRCGG